MFKKFKTVLFILCLFLSACSIPRKPVGELGAEQVKYGRFSASVVDKVTNEKTHGVQGGFALLDQNERLSLDLLSPLGSTLANIVVTPEQAILTKENGEQFRARSVDELMAKFGFPMPVSGVRYWIKGQLVPNEPSRLLKKDAQGNIIFVEQMGWQVTMEYTTQVPKRLFLNREDRLQKIAVRLTVD